MKHIILLVDDDPLILTTLQKRFDTWDMEVYSVTTPAKAKEVLEKVTPEIVLLDLLLTKDDGSSEILDFMKSQERLVNIPVLALTNMDKPELKKFMLSQGVKEYLIKGSMSLDEIYNKVLGYLEPAGDISKPE